MLKEVLAQQTSIVSKLHVTETELLSLSKSKGKDSTHEETRKAVKPFGPRAELNKEANVCTMLPTTSLYESDVNSHESFNCSSLFHDDGGFDSLQIGKVTIISSGNKMYLFRIETSSQQSTFLYPIYRLSTIGDVPG